MAVILLYQETVCDRVCRHGEDVLHELRAELRLNRCFSQFSSFTRTLQSQYRLICVNQKQFEKVSLPKCCNQQALDVVVKCIQRDLNHYCQGCPRIDTSKVQNRCFDSALGSRLAIWQSLALFAAQQRHVKRFLGHLNIAIFALLQKQKDQRLSLIREFINGLWLKGKSEGNIAFAYSQTLLAIIGDLRNEIAKEADSHYS